MKRITITNELGTNRLVLCVPGSRNLLMELVADFDSLDQPEFVNAIERKYDLEQIAKDGKGSMSLLAKFTPEQRETLVEDVAEIFADSYRENY